MTRREQIVYKAMSENIARAGEFGLCPGPFVAMRAEYRRVVRRENCLPNNVELHFFYMGNAVLQFFIPHTTTLFPS